MDIKKANVNLLLGKLRAFLNSVPPERRKGKKYVEAKKALTQLGKVFAGQRDPLWLKACRQKIRVVGG